MGLRRLTTTAGMWAVAAVGLTIGAGLFILGVGSAVRLLILLRFLRTGWLESHGLVSHDDPTCESTDSND